MRGEDNANLPDLIHTNDIAEWLSSELAFASGGSMGLAPLTFGDVLSWSQLTKTDVEPWEVRALVLASRAYVAEFEAAKTEARSEPNAGSEMARRLVAERMRQAMRGKPKK